MSNPQHKHDCDKCKFLCHVDGMDVYRCPVEGSLIARHSDDPADYSSTPASVFKMMLEIGTTTNKAGESVLFRDQLMTDEAHPTHRAYMIGLSLLALR